MTARERSDLRDQVVRGRLELTVACSRCGGHVPLDGLAKKGSGRLRHRCKGCESDRVLAAYYRRKAAA
jgi:hypothetical protein